MSLVQDRAMG